MKKKGWIEEPTYSWIKSLIPIPTIDLLVVYDEKLLLLLRNNVPAKDEWFTPGGRVLKGETLKDAVYRILGEETGLKPETITQIGTMSHIWTNVQTVTTIYKVEVENDQVQINSEHRDYKWIDDMDDNLHPYLKEMISKAKILE